MTKLRTLVGAAIALASVAGAPAVAQYYPYRYPQPRPGGVADQIARGAAEAAAAVRGVSDAVQGGYYGYGSYNSADRYAVNACGNEASRYGRVSISDVRPKSRDKMEVRGFVDPQGFFDRGYDYRSGHRGYERRTFACTVRYDGRVTKFKTKRLRY
jgi:hypothetical protein